MPKTTVNEDGNSFGNENQVWFTGNFVMKPVIRYHLFHNFLRKDSSNWVFFDFTLDIIWLLFSLEIVSAIFKSK